jgi:hypothetical protein
MRLSTYCITTVESYNFCNNNTDRDCVKHHVDDIQYLAWHSCL